MPEQQTEQKLENQTLHNKQLFSKERNMSNDKNILTAKSEEGYVSGINKWVKFHPCHGVVCMECHHKSAADTTFWVG